MTPEIILGPPGTGKTTSLLNIVDDELSSGTAPEQIGFVSFTRRAGVEARERAIRRFALDEKRFTYFRTIHSLCFRALGMTSGDVMAGQAVSDFADWINIPVTDKKRASQEEQEGHMFGNERGDRILQMENRARLENIPLRELYDRDDDGLSWWEVDRVARGLAEYKAAHVLHDYTDMLGLFCELPWSPQLEVLLVDEAQDLSMLQWRVVEKLARGARRVVIAGDDDQAIYRWAGAAVEYFVGMPGEVRTLGQSYRVPRLVQSLADHVISTVQMRRSKEWLPRDDMGEVTLVGLEDIDWSGPDMLVLARNAVHLNAVERQVRAAGYMYERHGHHSISSRKREAILTWENILRRGGSAPVSMVRRVYEFMTSRVGVAHGYKELRNYAQDEMVDMAELKARGGLLRDDVWYEALDALTPADRQYIQACVRRRERLSASPRIRLSTIHGSKGGEADEVVLLTDMARRTHSEAQAQPDDEARVWYVAATRARRRLTVVRPATRRHFTFRGWSRKIHPA